MNIAVVSNPSKLIADVKTPYTVVIQTTKKLRQYIRCETMKHVLATIHYHRQRRDVTFIHYNIPELDYIVAYDARDPTRYV